MKWIDMLKERIKEFQSKDIRSVKTYYFTDSNGFKYDYNVLDDEITIFLSNTDTGYCFKIIDKKIIWDHPENAGSFYSDAAKDHFEKFVESIGN